MAELYTKDRRILEKRAMEFRPFGVDPRGERVRDVTGVKIRAFIDCLEETVSRTRGAAAGDRAVAELSALLNARAPDAAYHVTPKMLKNVWNSYSYEFMCFLGEFCKELTGDARFAERVGREKFLSAVIQTLGRPFSLRQIYSMFPHFGE